MSKRPAKSPAAGSAAKPAAAAKASPAAAAAAASLPTSADLYVQVKNDPYVFSHLVRVGYFDGRKHRILYTPLSEWRTIDEGGDVPWSRVYQFMYGDEVLWDREKRICRVKEIHDRNKGMPKVAYGPVVVATLNLFNDRSKGSPFATRLEALAAQIAALIGSYDFVLLQEVPEAFIPRLASIASDAGAHLASTLGTDDIVDHLAVLSRHAIVNSEVHKLNRSKCFQVVDVLTEDLRTLRVMNVHLTSAMQADSAAKRAEQLLEVSKHAGGHHALIAGDFNERAPVRGVRGFRDALLAVASDDDLTAGRYSSFNPATNPLCVGVPGPIDKVLMSDHFAATSMQVLTDVQLSDHHPLIVTLDLSDVPVVVEAGGSGATGGAGTVGSAAAGGESKSLTTALCIVLPWQLWQPLKPAWPHSPPPTILSSGTAAASVPAGAASRPSPAASAASPATGGAGTASPAAAAGGEAETAAAGRPSPQAAVARWMPHLTVSLGFVPESEFFTIEPALAKVVDAYLPLEVEFKPPSIFEHDSAFSVVFELEDRCKRQLQLMRRELAALRLWRLEHAGAGRGEDYNPHLTIQKCASRAEAERNVRRVASLDLHLSFTCRKLSMVCRDRTPYMQVVNTVGGVPDTDTIDAILAHYSTDVKPMGSSLLLPPAASAAGAAVSGAPVAECARATGAAIERAIRDASAASIVDRDVCIVLKSSSHLEQLVRTLEQCGEVIMLKSLSNAHGRYLQLHTKTPGLTYDVHWKDAEALAAAAAAAGVSSYSSASAAIPPTGMDVILDRVDKAGKRDLFVQCLQTIKKRFKACGVYGQRFGFVPGYGLAIMVCRMVCDGSMASVDTCVADFCKRYSADGGLRVCNPSRTFTDMSARHIVIQNMMPPGDNVMRTATATSIGKLRRALAAGLAGPVDDSALCPFQTTIRVSASTLRVADAAISWFGSKFLGLVLKLERCGALTHDDSWAVGSSADYPFVYTFRICTDTPLTADIGTATLIPLQTDFYAMFEGAAMELEHGRTGA